MNPRSCITRRKSDLGSNASVKLGPFSRATFKEAQRRAQLSAPPAEASGDTARRMR
jgi:hypothetical protein